MTVGLDERREKGKRRKSQPKGSEWKGRHDLSRQVERWVETVGMETKGGGHEMEGLLRG